MSGKHQADKGKRTATHQRQLLSRNGDYSPGWIASFGHSASQVPQSRHASASITYFPSPSLIASAGQTAAQEPQDTQSSEITYAIIIYLLVNVHVLVRSEPYRYFNTFARNIQVKSLYFFLLSLAKNKERDYNEKYL